MLRVELCILMNSDTQVGVFGHCRHVHRKEKLRSSFSRALDHKSEDRIHELGWKMLEL